MPVDVRANLVHLTQQQFSAIAYDVMAEAFAVHEEFGHLFDEAVYQNALATRLNNILTEVQNLFRLMHVSRLESLQWINIARKKITFKTLHISVPNISVKKGAPHDV